MKKYFFSTMLVFLLPMIASADVVEINGVYYNLISKNENYAEVTENPYKYFGVVEIPERVSYEGTDYSVTSIGKSAFDNCRNLTFVTIPESVTSIGSYAFQYCSGLTSITIPGSIASMGECVFRYCNGLTSIIICDGVYNISKSAFERCISLKNIIIPNSLVTISNYAFKNCSALESVTIGNGVTHIGSDAFRDCNALKKVIIQDIGAWFGISFDSYYANPLYYAHHIFGDDEKEITEIVIPEGVTHLKDNTILNCTDLTSITIPNSVTFIGDWVFWGCDNLKSIKIPSRVTSIGYKAFQGCSAVEEIIVEQENPNYDSRNDCNAIINTNQNTLIIGCKNTVIPNTVTKIGNYAFYNCIGLKNITIPNNVTVIYDYAFAHCDSLINLMLPEIITLLGSAAFWNCSSLISISIPNGVTNVASSTFDGCISLKNIIIPESVTKLDVDAFRGCTSLANVYSYAETPPSARFYQYGSFVNAFEGSYIEYATLHVPESSIELYKTTTPWCDFGSIVSIEGDDPGPNIEPEPEKCSSPTISYTNGELCFSCETEGADFVAEVTDTDIKKYFSAKISLSATYNISVYATKDSYENSDTIQATLCWIDVEPQTDGIVKEDAVTELKAMPVLIQCSDGAICVSGAPDDTPINIYDMSGRHVGASTAFNGSAIIKIMSTEKIIIVKIGDKTVKVMRTI